MRGDGRTAGRRISDNVFAVTSRINSTWGGNLTDMVRARRILEVIETDELFENAAAMGRYFGHASTISPTTSRQSCSMFVAAA